MAIAVDSANNGSNSSSSPVTWTHDAEGTNIVLFVSVGMIAGTGASTADLVTAATYNGTNMTLIAKNGTNNGSNKYVYSYLYYVINPATGGKTISISFTTGNSAFCYGSSVSYNGAKQSGVPDSSASSNSAGSNVSSITGTTTVVASNCWTIMAAGNFNGTIIAGTNTTGRTNANITRILDSNGTVSTGSQSLQAVNNGGNDLIAEVIASFAPLAAVNSNFLEFF